MQLYRNTLKKLITLLLLLLLKFNFGYCQNDVIADNQIKTFPEITNFVNDFEDIFTFSQEVILTKTIEVFDAKSKVRIIIVTVDSISPYENIFDYSLALANQSGFGCIFIVICKNLRVIQIQNCDAILQKLTNEETKLIIDKYILPEFKKEDYFKGIKNGIREIKKQFE